VRVSWSLDPPDTAAHAPEGGWDMGRSKKLPYEGNDNAEDLATAEVGLALDPAGPWSKELDVTPLGGRTVTVYLKVTGRNAGDNYQIEVTKCGPGGCAAEHLPERVVALSPIVTAWKRIHIERDRMFRRGGVLYRSYGPNEGGCGGSGQPQCAHCGHDGYPACCGIGNALPCEQIEVYDWQDAQINDTIAIFDESAPYPDFGGEERLVLDIQSGSESFTKILTLEVALSQPYVASETDANTHQPTFANHHSAGYGVISGCDLAPNQLNASNSCFYQVDLRSVELAYNDAFVEMYAPRDGMSAVPLLAESWFNELNNVWQQDLSSIWFNNLVPYGQMAVLPLDPGVPKATLPAPHNYYHAIGASSQWKPVPEGRAYRLGITWAPYDATYLFRGSAEVVASGQSDMEKDRLCQHTAVHEIGHQFWVNGCVADGRGHDMRPAWCDSAGGCGPGSVVPQACVMDSSAPLTDRWDTSNRFCPQDLFLGDPTCGSPPPDQAQTTIRRQVDPF